MSGKWLEKHQYTEARCLIVKSYSDVKGWSLWKTHLEGENWQKHDFSFFAKIHFWSLFIQEHSKRLGDHPNDFIHKLVNPIFWYWDSLFCTLEIKYWISAIKQCSSPWHYKQGGFKMEYIQFMKLTLEGFLTPEIIHQGTSICILGGEGKGGTRPRIPPGGAHTVVELHPTKAQKGMRHCREGYNRRNCGGEEASSLQNLLLQPAPPYTHTHIYSHLEQKSWPLKMAHNHILWCPEFYNSVM